MATIAPTLSRRPARLLWIKILLALILLLTMAALGVRWYLFHAERANLPQLDGSATVDGLSARASIVRDQLGVPHISAQSLDDLAFAQGYATAQDRLWQMDMIRRLTAGELSEILGPGYLKLDRKQRYLQTRHTAEAALAQLSPAERSALEAYARGVNASREQHLAHLPLEFILLRYKPQPWRTADSLLAGLNMAEMLNSSYLDDWRREKVNAKLSPELIADLYPATSWRDHIPGEETQAEDDVSAPIAGAISDTQLWLARAGLGGGECAECRPGSNNWVVSGAHSATGRPLLSNDMHLEHAVPGIWYEAHLHLADGSLNVVGVTIPGLPAVIVGHNDRIAWGFTNLGPDVQDLFIENVNASGEYQTPQGWKPLERRHEVIHVKGGSDESFDVEVTRHGPIISPILPGEKRSLALRWTAYDGISFPMFEVDRARNWAEFMAAFSRFSAPGQNVVYADVDGHIGYHATGLVPLRAAGDGTVPVAGYDEAHAWTGYIPFDKLPCVFDPPSGVIATANSRVTAGDYPYLITKDWIAPYRTERIYGVLQAKPKLDADNMLALQMDVFSAVDKFFAERFVYAIDHAAGANARSRQAADVMRAWDGRVTADSAAAAIESAARRRLWRTLLESKLGDDWKDYSSWMSTSALENIVDHQPARWLPNGFASWNDLLAAEVNAAIKDAPRDLRTWSYGADNRTIIENPVIAQVPFLKSHAGPGDIPRSGNGTTVKQTGRVFGPSERFTADLSDWDRSRLNVVEGQSGNFLSPHFLDQWEAWYNGTTFDLPFSAAAVARGRKHELILLPETKS